MDGLKEFTKCSICKKTFTDPRMLQCLHSFCLKCLQDTVLKKETSENQDNFQCHICKTVYPVPVEGANGFVKNIFMLRLIDIIAKSTSLGDSVPCGICLDAKEDNDQEIPPAELYCIQCRKNICKVCSRYHRTIAELKKHQLLKLGAEITEDMFRNYSHQCCSQHEREPIKMFCYDCKQTICMMCFVEGHKMHECSAIERVGDIFRGDLKETVQTTQGCLKQWLAAIEQLADEEKSFIQRVKNTRKAIVDKGEKLKALVDTCMRSLIRDLDGIQQTQLSTLKTQREEDDVHQKIIESFLLYCQELESKGSGLDLCQGIFKLKDRAKEIQQKNEGLCQEPIKSIQVDFDETKLEEFLQTENIVGKIKETEKCFRRIFPEEIPQLVVCRAVSRHSAADSAVFSQSADQALEGCDGSGYYAMERGKVSVLIRSTAKLNFPSSSIASGVTKLENVIFILYQNNKRILGFDDPNPFNYKINDINIKKIKHPWDIASCEKSKCLYVSDVGNSCIWKVIPHRRRLTKWLTTKDDKPSTLSVTSDGHLLVVKWDNPSDEIKVYGPDAKLIRRLSLPNDIRQPLHVIQKQNKELLVSHKDPGTDRWVISLLTSDGQTVISRSVARDMSQELSKPIYLSLDSNSDLLFVADSRNDRVILYDQNSLQLITIFLTKGHGISRPKRLCFDGQKKQLIVGHEGKVDVYELDINRVAS